MAPVAAAGFETPIVDVRALAPAEATPFDAPPVDVRSLLYRGDSALARAQELRVQARRLSGDALHELIEEVCDLVALAIAPAPSGR